MLSSNSTRVASSGSVRRPESKDNNLKKIVLLNTQSKSTSKDVKKSQSSVSLVSNKPDILNSNVYDSKGNVLNVKFVNVVNDGSNRVCVSCGKDVFMNSHDKYVAHYALSVNSRVKRAFFTSHVASKSIKLGATLVVVKSKSLCYATNDRYDLGKRKPKEDIRILIRYSESSRGFRIYNH
nr:integrase, catalytic region, zinc finger, CCHC-type, peptidase aspartic, catalytic [Tanacetum cinerariifolium]